MRSVKQDFRYEVESPTKYMAIECLQSVIGTAFLIFCRIVWLLGILNEFRQVEPAKEFWEYLGKHPPTT